MSRPVTGQRILISGGSSGIGLATAERLGRSGARIVIVARGEPALEQAARRIAGVAGYIRADVRDPEQIEAACIEAARLLGGLDAVVADAAAAAYGPFVQMQPGDYTETVQTTLLGTMNTVHAALPGLAQTHGTLVIVGSVAARVPVPWLASYAAAKHGVRGFARSLVGELHALGIPVRVALVNPGPVDTRFWQRARTPDGRLPPELVGAYEPEDVALEVELAIRGRRGIEHTVGGLVAAWAFADAVAPNLALRLMAPLAALGWRNRHRRPRSDEDSLARPLGEADRSGELASRPSLLARLRERRPGV